MSITTRKTVKDEYLIVVDDSTADKHYFETSADQTIIDKPIAGVTGGNVAEALKNLATDIANAGDVKDVKNADGTSIVDANGVAQMKDAVVKEAGKVTNKLYVDGYNLDNTTRVEYTFDGGEDKMLNLEKGEFALSYVSGVGTVRLAHSGVVQGTYNGITVDSKGRVTKAVDGDYATNTDVNGKLDKKLDKAGGTVTGALAVNGGVTIGGNLTVNGTTTTVNSTTLAVADKLIEVASKNTAKLTTPAGIVVPKYDGTNSGALVFDGDGIASVGDVVLNANGDIDTTRSQLQTLATRTGLVDGKLVKYDGTNKTLVDTGKTVGDFATAAQGATADAAKAKADTNATDIANIKNGTTVVPNANHANTADSATNVTTNINGKAITSIFETNGTTVKNATHATSADSATTAGTATTANKVAHRLKIEKVGVDEFDYDGSKNLNLRFDDSISTSMASVSNPENTMVYNVGVAYTGIDPGVYTAVRVDYTGRATAGNRAFAVIGATDDIPSDVMVGGFILRAKA